jgi:quinoprotein glucose dehydrogenase
MSDHILRISVLTIVALISSGCADEFDATSASTAERRDTSSWTEYGGGQGQRFTPLTQINADNVARLAPQWVYRTGDAADGSSADIPSGSAFEVTPILADGALVFCTPFNRVIALDPLTGGELWQFDPEVDLSGNYGNQLVCRGVSHWQDDLADPASICRSRIFTATNDGYLLAIDSMTGKLCNDFGSSGRINLNRGVGAQDYLGEYQLTSAPSVVGNLVIAGGAISDNRRVDAPSGVVRAFDARSGRQVWANDLAPPDFDPTAEKVSDEGFALGTPNVWGTMIADPQRHMIYLPTGNPSPDYYRSGDPDMDYYGTAIVALDVTTGEVVWHFNTVINDFWDFDVGAQPSLVDLEIDGLRVPALIAGTKMGFIFVLNRETGKPVVDVEYRSVPVEGPLAAQLSPIQPFPPQAYRVAPEVSVDDAWGLTPIDRGECEDILGAARTGPIYTPVTEEWTVVAPSNLGGINWGGVAVDPQRQIIVARSSNVPFLVRLIPREEFTGTRQGFEFDTELATQRGTPYAMARKPLLSGWGLPCNKPPWGYVTAIDINTGQQLWQVPHGTIRDISPVPIPLQLGVPGVGGPLLTGSGLIFLGGAWENVLRAFDLSSGEELWQGRLPAGPQATPMSYSVTREDGSSRQFVLIAAGGHSRMGSTLGDYLVAFALPE